MYYGAKKSSRYKNLIKFLHSHVINFTKIFRKTISQFHFVKLMNLFRHFSRQIEIPDWIFPWHKHGQHEQQHWIQLDSSHDEEIVSSSS